MAPENGAVFTIYRNTPISQDNNWTNGEAFYADTITDAFNKVTMIAQELRGGSVNVPGTVETAHSATYATSAEYAETATNAGHANYANVASGLTAAAKTDIVNATIFAL